MEALTGRSQLRVYAVRMMTAEQIALVQGSFAQVLPVAGFAAPAFYERLFTLAPETRVLFRGDMGDQGRKLFLTLATVVDALDQLDQVIPVAQALAVRHVGYGVQERHYAVVGAALIDTLRGALGAGFDTKTEAAWVIAYTILSDTMLVAARGAVHADPAAAAA